MAPLIILNLSVMLNDGSRRMILDDVSVRVPTGSITGIVGGSGSGKTTLGMAVLGMISPAMSVVKGGVLVEGQDVLKMSLDHLRFLRGRRVGMVFQEPVSAFDPVFTIGDQIKETILAHEKVTAGALDLRVLKLLERVRVPQPERVAGSFPHELSGGLRQRAMIATAIACGPSLLIADEPTSSLDVTLQAHIMELFRQLRRELSLSIVLISHDLGMVSRLADEVVVMSDGKVIEQGLVGQITSAPQQDYTKRLIAAGGVR